jgi:hypothetical protein
LTGRKIIVDTYGGWGAHGGGAFSGKDFSKVDRSAAYTARWIGKSLRKCVDSGMLTVYLAKSLVAGGLARRALVQLSYAIGVAEPLSIFVDTYGTGKKTDMELVEIIRKNWDLRPGVIVKQLNLQQPIYRKTAAYGISATLHTRGNSPSNSFCEGRHLPSLGARLLWTYIGRMIGMDLEVHPSALSLSSTCSTHHITLSVIPLPRPTRRHMSYHS